MRDFERIAVTPSGVGLFRGRVVVTCAHDPTYAPTSVDLAQGDFHIALPRFAPYGVFGSDKGLRPYVWRLEAHGQGLVVGAGSLAAFDLAGAQPPNFVRLFRTEYDDPAWYSLDHRVLPNGGFSVVYEGGVLGFASDGSVRWHVPKDWGDVLLDRPAETMVFRPEEGDDYELSASTGERIPLTRK